MESLDITRREEDLGKKLVDLYGLTISYGHKRYGKDVLKISDPECHVYAVFADWHSALFGIGYEMSLNDAITRHFNNFKQKQISIIEFTSLDDLDIQLTLIGVNKG